MLPVYLLTLGKFTKSFQAARDEINGQFLNNQDWFLRTNRDQENSPFVQTKQECESATATQAIALLQNQRARICDQAKWHLEKVLSLYDFGVSLDILEANPNLRNLLMDAYKTFNADRLVKTQDNEPAKSEETQWAIF